jgi:hypothetical protein
MASNGELNNEMKTYEGFLTLMKWGTIISIALAALVVLLIA